MAGPDLGPAFQLVAWRPSDDKLGEEASRAISQWPAAQQAEQGWEWVRILVFLVQIALSAQGFDPGKPDGLMGPNTMMALLAWRVEKGEPIATVLEPSRGIADIVAQLLHVTLETMGLSPGPRDQILGQLSVAALKHWQSTFLWGALSMDIGAHKVARKTVMESFGQTPSSDAEETRQNGPPDSKEAKKDRSHDADEGQDRAAGDNSGKDAGHCVKFAWEHRFDWHDEDYQTEALDFQVINTCDFPIWFAWKGNGLAFATGSDREALSIYFRPLINSCNLADDQQVSPRGDIMDPQNADQPNLDFGFRVVQSHLTWRIFLLKGAIARVNYCAQEYKGELKGRAFFGFDWRPPDCVYRMPRPCGDDSDSGPN